MISAKWVFRAIFSLVGAVSIWMGASFFTKYIIHTKFSYYVEGEAFHWGVLSRSEERHLHYVDYSYPFRGERYSSQYVFMKPIFKSREAAEVALEGKRVERLGVWVLPKDAPAAILENPFPYNELIRFLVTTTILIYFYFLRRYLSHFTRSEKTPSN